MIPCISRRVRGPADALAMAVLVMAAFAVVAGPTTRAVAAPVPGTPVPATSATAVTASPVTGLEVVRTISADGSSAFKQATVRCPGNKKIIGAGSYLLVDGDGSADVLLDQVVPSAELNGVTVRASEDETGETKSWRVSAAAWCADPLPGLELVRARSGTDSTTSRTAIAICPAGKQILGAAGSISTVFGGQGELHIESMVPVALPSGEWAALFGANEDATGFTGQWSVESYALCADPVTGYEVKSSSTAGLYGWAYYGDYCPAGKKSVSAGGRVSGTGGKVAILGADNNIYTDDPTWVQVQSEEIEGPDPAPWTFTMAAVCASA